MVMKFVVCFLSFFWPSPWTKHKSVRAPDQLINYWYELILINRINISRLKSFNSTPSFE